MENNNISFGCMNTKTDEFQEGFMKNEEMKFKKVPWYKRIFAKEPREEVFVGTVEMTRRFVWSDIETPFSASLYKLINPLTGETKKLYARTHRGGIYFDPNAYEKNGVLVRI